MNQTERVNNAVDELEQVRANIQKTVWALRTLHQEALASSIMDWSVIIHSAICEIRDAHGKAIDERTENNSPK